MSWKVIFLLWLSCLSSSYALPNIVFFLTDDLDVTLSGFKALNKTKELIADAGATFENAFVTTPICCPSRASILTGQYLRNTGTINNEVEGNCASQEWRDGPETRTFGTYLKDKGYNTLYAGKYLNQYGVEESGTGVEHIPPGWDEWNGLVGNSKYYNYKLSINGELERHGENYEEDYLTDVIGRQASAFLDNIANSTSPFFMVLSTPSPHGPFTPAPQYENEFPDEKAPRTPAFNYVDEPGYEKHWLVRTEPRQFDAIAEAEIDRVYRARLQTLLSVDDLVSGVLSKIPDPDNTFVIFTSDHGYHLGEFGMTIDKRQMYENDIRIPMLIRGPGITGGTTSKAVALSIDLAPTILDMAGIETPDLMDGKSLLPFITETGETPVMQTDFLVEYNGAGGKGNDPECAAVVDMENQYDCKYDIYDCKCRDCFNNTFTCVRTIDGEDTDTVLCQFQDDEDFIELYDLKEDPYQLYNLAPMAFSDEEENQWDVRTLIADAQTRIAQLQDCQGWRECLF